MNAIKNIIKSFAVSFLMILSGCTDLDETIYDKISEENLEFSDEDISRLTGYAFNELRYIYWGWDGLFDIQEESSDLLMTPLRIGVGWGDYYIAMHQHDFNPNISHLYTAWEHGYRGITYCNKVLDIEEVQADPSRSAEVRALRATYYYILFDLFRNIPLETTLNVEDGYQPTQNDPQEVFDFMVNELNEIKDDLGTENVYGHPNRYVVDMLLAKIYLNHNAWFNDHSSSEYYELALAEVEDVLQNGPYTLASAYKDNFMDDISQCSEIIFALPLDFTYASHNYTVNKALISAGAAAFGYNGSPWNGSCAVPQFIDTYHSNDTRLDDTWAHGQQYDFESGDPITTDADDQGEVNLVYTQRVHSINNPGAYMLEGYRFVKNEIVPGTDGTYGDDVPFFRLADAMFIKAECLLRLGRNQDEAANLITQVRLRAFENSDDATRTVADLTGGSIYDYGHREYTSLGATNYDEASFIATYEGGDDIELGGLLDDLAWEFVGEHHRRQDLVRFRMANGANVYNGKSWFCKDAETDLSDHHKDIFPIHQNFLNANINLKQNPDY